MKFSDSPGLSPKPIEKVLPWSVFAIFAYAGNINNEHIVIVEKEEKHVTFLEQICEHYTIRIF